MILSQKCIYQFTIITATTLLTAPTVELESIFINIIIIIFYCLGNECARRMNEYI